MISALTLIAIGLLVIAIYVVCAAITLAVILLIFGALFIIYDEADLRLRARFSGRGDAS